MHNLGILKSRAATGSIVPSRPKRLCTRTTPVTITSGSLSATSRQNSSPLFGTMLMGIQRQLMSLQKLVTEKSDMLMMKVEGVEQKVDQLSSEVKELRDMAKGNYSIKGTPLEVDLRSATGTLFCRTLTRYPDDDDIKDVVKTVLGQDASVIHKYDAAFKFENDKLSSFRTAEQRKVLGKGPYKKACYMNTPELADNLMHQIIQTQVTENADIRARYIMYLAIFRKFAREEREACRVNHMEFKEWLKTNYSTGITEMMWQEIMKEDAAFDYSTKGSTKGNGMNEVPQVGSEITIPMEEESDSN